MDYKQLIPFNTATAGTVRLECEKNVRLGFGVASKYTCAWQNWVHTDQHTDAIPTGVDVPVFFSYIDANNGHIGVRLANDKFWSDGTVYDSIAAYTANHTPKYVGWSTKVDDVPVIALKGENMLDDNGTTNMWLMALRRKPVQADLDYWRGQPYDKLQAMLMNTPEYGNVNAQITKGEQAQTVNKQAVISYLNSNLK